MFCLSPGAHVIATNRALEWVERDNLKADVAFLFDQVACERWGDTARLLRARDKTHLVTLAREHEALKRRGVVDFDEFIGPARFKCKPDWFARGEWNDVGLSGLWSVQYAINKGAEVLHLVGHEGYRAGEHPTHLAKTKGVIEPHFAAMVKACPDVQFRFYGDMTWNLPEAENVVHMSGVYAHANVG